MGNYENCNYMQWKTRKRISEKEKKIEEMFEPIILENFQELVREVNYKTRNLRIHQPQHNTKPNQNKQKTKMKHTPRYISCLNCRKSKPRERLERSSRGSGSRGEA